MPTVMTVKILLVARRNVKWSPQKLECVNLWSPDDCAGGEGVCVLPPVSASGSARIDMGGHYGWCHPWPGGPGWYEKTS